MSPVDGSQVKDAAPLFSALGDETRLRLLLDLCSGGPLSIAHLSGASPVSRQAVTKHLELLARAGLVRSVRQGRERIWEVAPERIDEAHRYLERISKGWDDTLARLKDFAER